MEKDYLEELEDNKEALIKIANDLQISEKTRTGKAILFAIKSIDKEIDHVKWVRSF